MSGGSKAPSTTTTVQKSEPWAGQQSYLLDVFNEAQKQYQGGKPEYYPGQTSAPIDPATKAAQDYFLQQAGGSLAGIGQQAGQSAQFNLNDARYVESNPYLQQAIQAAQRPVIQAFTDPGGTLSQARTGFVDAGQYGGSRHGLAEGVAYGRLGQTLGDISAGMANQGYESGLKASLQQQALLPQVQGAILAPGTVGEAVGQQREAYQQQMINEAIARWNFEQNRDPAALAQYQSLIQGSYGGSGTGAVTGPQPTTNRAMGVLGGAATGAAAGSMFGPGYGTAIGAGIGALYGLFAS